MQRRPGACHAVQYICTPQAGNTIQASSHSISTLHLVPSHLSNSKTCRITLPIGTPAEGRHTHTEHVSTVENYQEHVHAHVYLAFTYSVLQCPGIMPGFLGLVYMGIAFWQYGFLGIGIYAQQPVPPGMKEALAPLWTLDQVSTPYGRKFQANESGFLVNIYIVYHIHGDMGQAIMKSICDLFICTTALTNGW